MTQRTPRLKARRGPDGVSETTYETNKKYTRADRDPVEVEERRKGPWREQCVVSAEG